MHLPVDHLIYAAPDLAEAIDRLDRRLGVRPAVGGRHPAWGTHNAILSLGLRMYLELLPPDPEADEPTAPRPLGLDALAAPRLVTWVAAGTDLEQEVLIFQHFPGTIPGIESTGRRSWLRHDWH